MNIVVIVFVQTPQKRCRKLAKIMMFQWQIYHLQEVNTELLRTCNWVPLYKTLIF